MDVNSECKFCSVHKYGVIVLNVSALCLLLAVICIYWNEILSFCCRTGSGGRRSRPEVNRHYTRTFEGQQQQQQQQSVDPNTFNITRQADEPTRTNDTGQDFQQQEDPQMRIIRLQQQQQMQQLQQQQQQQQILPPQPPPQMSAQMPQPPPPAQTSVHIAIPMPPQLRYYGAHKHKHHNQNQNQNQNQNRPQSPVSPKSPADSPQASPASPPADPFKLPKPTEPQQQQQQVTAYESTGSDYFKQMLKGKKPVASISQYRNIKHQAKKAKKPKKAKDKNKDKQQQQQQQEKNKGKTTEPTATNVVTNAPASGGNKEVLLEKFITKEARKSN